MGRTIPSYRIASRIEIENWKSFRPQLGNADSEIIRNIVLAYLIEKGYLLKNKGKKESVGNEQIASELEIHDEMITTLAEMLEEKGQLDYQAWERRVQKKLHKG